MISYTYQNHEFTFYSDNGIFSKDKIDFGSKLLIEIFLKNNKKEGSILDIGCGYGFMGIVATYFLKGNLTLSDVNKRALHLAEKNMSKNKVTGRILESNCYENINEEYDYILSNPPIRAGKNIVLDIILKSKEHLKENGSLWFVIRKDQGAKSIMKEVQKKGNCQIIEKSKGFYIMRAEFS